MIASQPGGYLGGHHVPLLDQYIASQLRAIRPRSIIDFGAGRGLLGYLIRAALGSTVDVTAVERFEPACRRLQSHPGYDRVVQRLIEEYEPPSAVDVSLYGDVLEHLPRLAAFAEIRRALEFSHHVLVAVPLRNLRWNYDEDNPLEIHRAYLCESDFTHRFRCREIHVVECGDYPKLNAWIVGTQKAPARRWLRDAAYQVGGRRLAWLRDGMTGRRRNQ